MQLGSNLKAEWEVLGRMLNVSESDLNAIKTNNVHMVEEQALQMFKHCMGKQESIRRYSRSPCHSCVQIRATILELAENY